MVKREIYSVGLKRKVEADVDEIIATPSRGGGFRYQVVGFFTDEDGKKHKCQSMIGKADAQTVAAALGQSLPTTESELKEAETVESFAAEEDAAVEAPELLVPEPSSSPNGNGRVLGQHTGGEIISATDASQSLPAHDYIFVGRAEDQAPDVDAMAMGIEEGEQDIEDLDAEFVEVIDSVSNVWSDEADGSETFVVEEELKDYLIEEFYEETFEGLFSVSRHDSGADLWEVTFPYFMSEDVIDSIAQYQDMSMTDGEMDKELADWVRAEEFNARGLVDSDDLFEESSRGISKSTAAIATAVLALGAAYWWSQRK
jgi:hypothetical protein|tara:strand:+ start:298 stop:1239 length:942 start_codon:yes stop_codon:yes gene_type:complete